MTQENRMTDALHLEQLRDADGNLQAMRPPTQAEAAASIDLRDRQRQAEELRRSCQAATLDMFRR
jgi:hypothetical protein